jgi:hypothetical protein
MVTPLAVTAPPLPEALTPVPLAVVTLMVVPGGTVQGVPLATAGVGQVCAEAAPQNAKVRIEAVPNSRKDLFRLAWPPPN